VTRKRNESVKMIAILTSLYFELLGKAHERRKNCVLYTAAALSLISRTLQIDPLQDADAVRGVRAQESSSYNKIRSCAGYTALY
jgi:two-component SAPR family response regulator